jgi:hypothetical protein
MIGHHADHQHYIILFNILILFCTNYIYTYVVVANDKYYISITASIFLYFIRQVLYSYAFRLVKSFQWKTNCKASTVTCLVLLFNVDDSLFIFSFFLLIQFHKYSVFLLYVHHFSHLLLLTHKHAIEGEYGDKIHSSKFFSRINIEVLKIQQDCTLE